MFLQSKDCLPIFTELVAGFKAALQQISNSDDNVSKYRVVGSEGLCVYYPTKLLYR